MNHRITLATTALLSVFLLRFGCALGPGAVTDGANAAPIADAGPDQTADPGVAVTLSGLSSSDPDGGAIFFEWRQISGPTVAIDDPNSATIELVLGEDGTYEFTLTVSDDRGGSSSDSVRIFVGSATPVGAPQADAGVDQTVSEGVLVTLRGQETSGHDQDTLTFTWQQLLGPAVMLSSSSAANPTFTAPEVDGQSELFFRFTVNSDNGLTDSDFVAVVVRATESDVVEVCQGDDDCEDGDPCTTDDCQQGVCAFEPVVCVAGESCVQGSCVPAGQCVQDSDCPEDHSCVDDLCVPSGCVSDSECDDGNPCTVDDCTNGSCVSQAIECNVGETCLNGDCIAPGVFSVAIIDCPGFLQSEQATTLSAAFVNAAGNVTFDWSATSGSFDDPSSDTPTLSVGSSDVVITVTATDQGSTATAEDTCSIEVTIPILFVANSLGNSVASFVMPATLDGNVAPDTVVSGGQTQLDQSSDVVVSPGGFLFAINTTSNALNIYENATTVDGNAAPDRVVQGASTMFASAASIALDPGSDLVFIINILGQSEILVFPGATDSGFSGDVAPTRTITNAALVTPFGLNLDDQDNLYVANTGRTNVLVFANASTADGDLTPSRTITSDAFTNLFDVFVDGQDNLYVVDTGDQEIIIFHNASGLDGLRTPDARISIPDAISLAGIVVDPNGTGFVSDSRTNAVYSFDNISTLNGTIEPDRTIQGFSTQFNNPVGLFLFQLAQ